MPQFGITGSIGNVYEFTTVNGSTTEIIQLAGSAEIFPKSIYNTYYFTDNSSIQSKYPSTIDFDSVTRSSLFGIKPTRILPSANQTSSYTTFEQFHRSGSVLSIRGTNDHHIILDNSLPILGQIFYVNKETNSSTQQIKIELTTQTIHGSSSLASTSPYCSIMLINIGGPDCWSIISKIGDWS